MRTALATELEEKGFLLISGGIPLEMLATLRERIFLDDRAGTRCLLDDPAVRETAGSLKRKLVEDGHLPETAVAIQAIAFDKTAATNWKVAWHQDLMFPFEERVRAEGFDLPSVKQEVHHARPPVAVLDGLLAARLHLDDCGEGNGPLRVSPGTHRAGMIDSAGIADVVARQGECACLAVEGEVLLMKPLLLHASSQATEPKHRRVLHFVYHTGEPIPERWHRAV